MPDTTSEINHEARAFLAWPRLTERATQRTTITYLELGELIGGVHQRAIARTLGPIQDYCLAEQLPPLTILVVQKTAKMPGHGFIAWERDDMQAGLEQVFAYPWDTLPNPFAYAGDGSTTRASLVRRLVSNPNLAADIYASVRVRGIAQQIFRDALLEAYDGACAFCGMTFVGALEAAHIIPWPEATLAQRLDPRNGILLCRTHHSLFDDGHLWLDETCRVMHDDTVYGADTYSAADTWFTRNIHARHIRLPADGQLHPDPAWIALRYKK
jgi:putative restriction endonuclease